MRRRKDFASASAGIRTPQRMQTPIRSDRCEHCGAWLNWPQISIRETAANVVCGSLLLAVLTLAGYASSQWIEREGSILQAVWHEPLEDWSR
jgi:hypothetical protein